MAENKKEMERAELHRTIWAIAFDENCLKAVFRAYDIAYSCYDFDCTLLKSRKVWPEGHHNLDIIAGYCGYDLTTTITPSLTPKPMRG